MFSERFRFSRAGVVSLTLLMVAVLLLSACGKKGDPLPPLRTVPLVTKDLEVRQQGSFVLFELGYPATTSAGMALGGIDAVELYRLERPAADGEVPQVQPSDFESSSELVRTLRGTELEAAIVGERIQFRLSLDPASVEQDPPNALIFAVRTVKALESSDLSNRIGLVPSEPPSPPTGLDLIARRGGVEVHWQSDDAEGFDVFRRLATERGYGSPIRSIKGDRRQVTDTSARYGERYIYTVRAIDGEEIRIESELASEAEIEYKDTFAPRLPNNVVALPEQGAVRLRWEPSPDADTAGYFVHRRDAGRDTFIRLNDQPVASTEYLDRGLASGLSFAYRIQAVDGEGNASELSKPVVATTR